VIEIYKVVDNDSEKKTLVEKLSYLKHIPAFGNKWEFIEQYWNQNYEKFE